MTLVLKIPQEQVRNRILFPKLFLATVRKIGLEYWNFNRGPSKLDAPISSKQFSGLKLCF